MSESSVELQTSRKGKRETLLDAGDVSLLKAAITGNLVALQQLIQAGCDLQQVDNFTRQSALHIAAASGHENLIAPLLEAKISVNVKDKYGNEPLHGAAICGHREVATILLAQGASVNSRDSSGSSPLHMAVLGNRKEMVDLLIKQRADAAATDIRLYTAIHLITENSSMGMVRALIRAKCDPNATDNNGQSASDKSPEVAALITQATARVSCGAAFFAGLHPRASNRGPMAAAFGVARATALAEPRTLMLVCELAGIGPRL